MRQHISLLREAWRRYKQIRFDEGLDWLSVPNGLLQYIWCVQWAIYCDLDARIDYAIVSYQKQAEKGRQGCCGCWCHVYRLVTNETDLVRQDQIQMGCNFSVPEKDTGCLLVRAWWVHSVGEKDGKRHKQEKQNTPKKTRRFRQSLSRVDDLWARRE